MGKKNIKVGNNLNKHSEMSRTSAWADRGKKTSARLYPSFRHILIGLSVCQMVMVAVSAATLGAFVNSNMKEIVLLKQTTENMQAKIDILEAKKGAESSFSHNQNTETKWQQIETKISDVQTKYETNLFTLINNLTRLEGDSTAHHSTVKYHDARLTQLELSQTNCTCNDTIRLQAYVQRIIQIDEDNAVNGDAIQQLGNITAHIGTVSAECLENMQTINSTMEQLSRDIYANTGKIATEHRKIEQLELERALDRLDIQNHNESITTLEFDSIVYQVAIDNVNKSITNLIIEEASFRADIKRLNISIIRLEQNSAKHQTIFQNISASISNLKTVTLLDRSVAEILNSSTTQLQIDIGMQIKALRDQNRTLINLQEDVEKDRTLIQNMNDRLSVLDAERQTDIITIKANSEAMAQLGRNINATYDLCHILELRVSDLEDLQLPQLGHDINATYDLTHRLELRVSHLEDVKSAFTVYSPVAGLTSGSVRFTDVITNIPGHYNTSTGIFTCEYPGIYVFALHILKNTGSDTAYCHIRKNGSNVVIVYTNPDTNSGQYGSSNSIVIHLLLGDTVDLDNCSANIDNINTSYTFTTFSGFLLKAD